MPKGRASLLVSLSGIPPAIKNSIDARTFLQNTILDEVVNEFVVSSSVRVDLAQLAMQSNKRMLKVVTTDQVYTVYCLLHDC